MVSICFTVSASSVVCRLMLVSRALADSAAVMALWRISANLASMMGMAVVRLKPRSAWSPASQDRKACQTESAVTRGVFRSESLRASVAMLNSSRLAFCQTWGVYSGRLGAGFCSG